MPGKPLYVDIRDPRVPGGRLTVAAGTADAATRNLYRASVLAVLDTPHGAEVVRRLKMTKRQRGKLVPAEVHEAVRTLNVAALVAKAADAARTEVRPAMLGVTIDRFLTQIRSDAAAGTSESYEIVCRLLEERFGVRRGKNGKLVADTAVRSIEREEARTWLKEPKKAAGDRPWSANRQSVVHAVASQLWAMARVEEEDQAESLGVAWKPWRNFWAADRQRPKATVRAAKVVQTRHNFLHRDQAARLLRQSKGTPRAAFVAVGFYAGLRIGEAIHLRTSKDLNLETGTLTVQSRKGDYPWRTKNGKPRDVPMSGPLTRWISRHIRDGFAGERYLFHPSGADKPLSHDTAAAWTRDAFEAAGIKYGGRTGDALSNHALRHTFGTWLAMHGFSPATIAELMGDTVAVVVKTYLHHYPSEKRRAVERMRRRVG